MKPSKKLLSIAAVMTIISLTSCNRYFMAVPSKQPATETIKKYLSENRQFILRHESLVYEMRNTEFNEEKNELSCELQPLPGLKTVYNPSRSKKDYYYKPARPDSIMLNQIHLHTSHNFTKGTELRTTIPVTSIKLIEALQFDKNKTTRRDLAVGLALTASVAMVVGTIALVNALHDIGNIFSEY